MGLPHPSHPGHFGLSLSAAAADALGAVADALIPAGDSYPSARDAGVVEFVADRMAPVEAQALESLLAGLPSGGDVAGWLRELERERPEDLLLLTTWVYQAYWCSHAALAALRRRGSDYHGAPQPLGYRIPDYDAAPSTPRGGYIATEEVTRVVG